MHLTSVKGYSPAGQLFMLFVFFIGGLILAAVAQTIITFSMMPGGVSITDMGDVMQKAMNDPANVNMLRLAQVLGTFFLLFVPAILFAWVTYGRDPFWLGLNRHINAAQILIGFVIIFAATVMAAPLADLTKDIVAGFPKLDALAKKMETAYNESVLLISNLKSWPEFITAIFIMAFFPALFEELFFRGGLQNILVRLTKSPVIAIVITSLLFSLIHISIYLFLSRAILGFVLGLMYHKTKNIWVNVIAHFLNNAIAVTQLFWMSSQNKKLELEKLDPKVDWWYGIIALLALIYLFKYLSKLSARNRQLIEVKEQKLYAEGNTHDPFTKNDLLRGAE